MSRALERSRGLSVLAWDHPRATRPLAAASEAWAARTGRAFTIETRSLASFGDETPAQGGHDLVLIDHPHIGSAASNGAILELDGLLDESSLAERADDSIGPSHESYQWQGRQWALAVDAACQVLACHPGLVAEGPVPETWEDVLALAAAQPGRVALPLHPAHAISAFLSLVAARGVQVGTSQSVPRGIIEWAVEVLTKLAFNGPREAFNWEPPEVLEVLARGDLACVPLVYGYVGYEASWRSAPRHGPDGRPGSILGGVGVAVLAGSTDPTAAARLADWLASAHVQRTIIGPSGGQPASRTAWSAADADPLLPAMRETIEASQIRPRDPSWPAFQREAGELLTAGLARGQDPSDLASTLARLLGRRHLATQ